MTLRLGKRPARDAISFRFGTYFDASRLPTPPALIGRPQLVAAWGMLGNDQVGNCCWAGAAHETMLWCAEAKSAVTFTDQSVIGDYSAATGYTPSDPNSDAGTDVQQAASYRQKTGIADASGTRHRIDAYVALLPGNVEQLALAAYLFGAAGIGIQLPTSAMDQFEAGQPWSVVAGATVEGGHYVPVVGRNSRGNFMVVTWGRLQAVTPGFLAAYMDEGVGYLSLERLRGSVSPQGFDEATLQADLGLLRASTPASSTSPQQENTMATTTTPIDQSRLIAVKAAIQKVVSTFSYLGIKVGDHVTDAEITAVATAAIQADDDYQNAPTI
jgi:hypothetical protein